MFPVEKKADCRRKRKNRAGRISERFRLRHIGWLFGEEEGETEEAGVIEEAGILVDNSPRAEARGLGVGVGVGDGGFGLWVVRKLWMWCSRRTQVSKVLQKTK